MYLHRFCDLILEDMEDIAAFHMERLTWIGMDGVIPAPLIDQFPMNLCEIPSLQSKGLKAL